MLAVYASSQRRSSIIASQVTDRTLHKIKCKRKNDARDGNDMCVVVGDDGGVYVTSTGFSPNSISSNEAKGLYTEFTRHAAFALSNRSSDLLTVSRLVWGGTQLRTAIVGGTRGTILHLVPNILTGELVFEIQVR